MSETVKTVVTWKKFKNQSEFSSYDKYLDFIYQDLDLNSLSYYFIQIKDDESIFIMRPNPDAHCNGYLGIHICKDIKKEGKDSPYPKCVDESSPKERQIISLSDLLIKVDIKWQPFDMDEIAYIAAFPRSATHQIGVESRESNPLNHGLRCTSECSCKQYEKFIQPEVVI